MFESTSTIPIRLLADATRQHEEFVTELRYVPEGWLAVGGVALLLLICGWAVWTYRHEGRLGASARVRMLLALLRCGVLLTLATILLEPVRVRILRQWIDSYTIVLADTSSSMDLADAYRDERAQQRAQSVLGDAVNQPLKRTALLSAILGGGDRAFLRGLAANNRVKLFTFAGDAEDLGAIRADWEKRTSDTPSSPGTPTPEGIEAIPLTFEARGPVTNMERSLRRALESIGGAPIAGVVVLSDGGLNQGASAEEVARFARDRRVPIYAVGVGDPSSPRNARVTEVLAPENAFQNDPIAIQAGVAWQGLEGEAVRVELREQDLARGAPAAIVESASVTAGPDGSVSQVAFERRQSNLGRFVYTVEIPVLDTETVTEDNSRQTSVNVIDSRTRVLLLASQPSWEYRYVTRLLQRDPTFELSCWLQSADLAAVRDGATPIDHIPQTAEELFAYDVIILMDPDPSEFGPEWMTLIDTGVTEYGGGLLYAAARIHTPTTLRDPGMKPLRDMLPVTLDPEAELVLNQVGHYQLRGAPLEIPAPALGHPAMRAAADPGSTKLAWQDFGDIHWHYPVLREKAAATVLMRHGDPRMRNSYGGHVLGAVQFLGAGRTGFLGFDGTWRWRRQDVAGFDRFWVQLLRFLAEGKLLGGGKRGTIMTESDEYAVGDTVTMSARLVDVRYEPLDRPEVTATYSVDGESRDLTLTARPDRPGWFEGRFVADRTGTYVLGVTLPGTATGEPMEISRQIRVSRPNLEILRPQMDRQALMTLAEESHGGRYFEVDEASAIPALIPDLHEEVPVRSRPTTLWDRWPTLVLLVGLLSVEWGVRKWKHLL